MINAEERKERERLRKEAEKERESIIRKLPRPRIAMPKTGLQLDLTDRKNTRLIWKNPRTSASCWRTVGGNYIELRFGNPDVKRTAFAHQMMKQRDNGTYMWYITEAEVNELIEDDNRIERKRSLGL